MSGKAFYVYHLPAVIDNAPVVCVETTIPTPAVGTRRRLKLPNGTVVTAECFAIVPTQEGVPNLPIWHFRRTAKRKTP